MPSTALNYGKLPGHNLLVPCISSNMFSSFKGRTYFNMLNNMSMRTCTTLHAVPATSIEKPCADLLNTFVLPYRFVIHWTSSRKTCCMSQVCIIANDISSRQYGCAAYTFQSEQQMQALHLACLSSHAKLGYIETLASYISYHQPFRNIVSITV